MLQPYDLFTTIVSFLADFEVASLAKSLAQVVADEVWMIEVCRKRFKNKQKQCLSLCIPSGEALARVPSWRVPREDRPRFASEKYSCTWTWSDTFAN